MDQNGTRKSARAATMSRLKEVADLITETTSVNITLHTLKTLLAVAEDDLWRV
jgi:hypothetical protein